MLVDLRTAMTDGNVRATGRAMESVGDAPDVADDEPDVRPRVQSLAGMAEEALDNNAPIG